MDFAQIFQTLLALIFVLGLMFLSLWLIKFCQQKGLNCRLGRSLNTSRHIKIIEQRRLDMKNTLVLLQCDNDEFLLLLGNNNNLLLRQTKSQSKVSPHD